MLELKLVETGGDWDDFKAKRWHAGGLWGVGERAGAFGKVYTEWARIVPGLWESAERTGASAAGGAGGDFSNPPDGRRTADALQQGAQWWREEALGVVPQQ